MRANAYRRKAQGDDSHLMSRTFLRYLGWFMATMGVGFLGMLAAWFFLARNAEAASSADTQGSLLLMLACIILPMLAFGIFFLFYKKDDPYRARTFGILFSLLITLLMYLFVHIQGVYFAKKAAELALTPEALGAEVAKSSNLFTGFLLVLAAAGYLAGPFRLMLKERRQRKKSAEDFGLH